MTVTELLAALINEKGLTQVEIAKAINCSQATVSRYIKGDFKPTFKIAKALILLAKKKRIKVKMDDIYE
jgi:predicted transcriptional regulator